MATTVHRNAPVSGDGGAKVTPAKVSAIASSSSSATSSATSIPGSGSRRRYERLRLLGTGSFGQAWLVLSRASGKQYVVKEIRLPAFAVNAAGLPSSAMRKEQEQFFNEISIIRSCSHVNIIRYKECFIAPEDGNAAAIQPHFGVGNTGNAGICNVACIVMEYADAGDLHDHIRHWRDVRQAYIDESTIRNWFVQICFALDYLHKKGILHRDLKTQNIFLTSRQLVKLGDFGISRTLCNADDFATTSIGTPQYLSPEICQQRKYDFKSDIWGLGCVLYEMCALCHAFPGTELPALIQNIVRGNYKPVPNVYSRHLAELVKVMLRPDPVRRPTVEQVLNARVLRDDVLAYMAQIKSALPEVKTGPDSEDANAAALATDLDLAPLNCARGGVIRGLGNRKGSTDSCSSSTAAVSSSSSSASSGVSSSCSNQQH